MYCIDCGNTFVNYGIVAHVNMESCMRCVVKSFLERHGTLEQWMD